jgi:hypothetical protein
MGPDVGQPSDGFAKLFGLSSSPVLRIRHVYRYLYACRRRLWGHGRIQARFAGRLGWMTQDIVAALVKDTLLKRMSSTSPAHPTASSTRSTRAWLGRRGGPLDQRSRLPCRTGTSRRCAILLAELGGGRYWNFGDCARTLIPRPAAIFAKLRRHAASPQSMLRDAHFVRSSA